MRHTLPVSLLDKDWLPFPVSSSYSVALPAGPNYCTAVLKLWNLPINYGKFCVWIMAIIMAT